MNRSTPKEDIWSEVDSRTRELDLKEREIAAKEREVAAKEVELSKSRWLHPMVIGLFVAAIGLIGNLVVARVNNQSSQQLEGLRLQSNLVTEAIKAPSSDDACKNLLFFWGLGLVVDSTQTIQRLCGTSSKDVPSLFPSFIRLKSYKENSLLTVIDATTGSPVSAQVTVGSRGDTYIRSSDSNGVVPLPMLSPGERIHIEVVANGYVSEAIDRNVPPGGWTIVQIRKLQ